MLFTIVGCIGLLWFMMPFFLKRIINIGNVTGVAICLVLLIYGIYRKRIHKIFAMLLSNRAGKVSVIVASFVVSAVVIISLVETVFMIGAATKTPTKSCTVVVLGCKAYSFGPSTMLRSRLDAAYDYLIENPDSKCVVSGGQGKDEEITEASCMFEYLVEKGIDEERIYIEDKSTSTRENLEFSKKIIEDNNLNKSIAIVTNEYHEYRAGRIADKLEMDYYAVPADTDFISIPTYYVRELYGILYEWIA